MQLTEPSGEFVRCPSCGGMVQMPCLACYFLSGHEYPKEVIEAAQHPENHQSSRPCKDMRKHDDK